MARKKAARSKKAAPKKNPATALKDRLAKMNAELKAVKAMASDTAKRTAALEKEHAAVAKAKKPAAKKKTAKKRRVAKKKK